MINPQLITPSSINFNLFSYIDAQVLFVILGLFFIFYVVVSVALFYHWIKYGMNHSGVLLAETIFFLGSVVLFTVAILSINYY